MLTVIFSVNLNIPLLLWAWGCRQKPPPCVLERAVQAASTTLPRMMDGLAHCPCFCRIAWVGQVCLHTLYIKGSTSINLRTILHQCRENVAQSHVVSLDVTLGHTDQSPVAAPRLSAAAKLTACFWTSGGFIDVGHVMAWWAKPVPDLLGYFFFKCPLPKTSSEVLILVLAFKPVGFKASLWEHPFHFSLIVYYLECSDVFPFFYFLSLTIC